ncbi:integration host factor subunit alpha [Candidatus Methylospira mobilis]|uniref:integration host factor subunit alpha n=1 Tax=Candidatus Methylospira mobilis TaxID=1808979 RepID=UPI0028E62A1A|nr:integration host factor subunit alpha [Candidatus Methylospira mobilis]WNV03394.1 integration host factor subunit alpha [Candidatus Methylospira mobilis]
MTTTTLTKAQLANTLLEAQPLLDQPKALQLVNQFFETIKSTLEAGESVKLSGFGNFNVRDNISRPGRNPKTGEEALITARRVVTFKAGQKLNTRIKTTK